MLVSRKYRGRSAGKRQGCDSGVLGCPRRFLQGWRNPRGGGHALTMPKLPGVNHLQAIRALEKAGFEILRQGSKHVVLTDGVRFLTVPRNNPVNAFTMGGI